MAVRPSFHDFADVSPPIVGKTGPTPQPTGLLAQREIAMVVAAAAWLYVFAVFASASLLFIAVYIVRRALHCLPTDSLLVLVLTSSWPA